MATELLSTASTAANSADIVITQGASALIVMRDYVNGNAVAELRLKDEDGVYHKIWELTPAEPVIGLSVPGTYRLSRVAGAICGAFQA